MTRHTIHTLAHGGLTHAAISAKTGASVSTIQRILKCDPPAASELASHSSASAHIGRPSVVTHLSDQVVRLLTDRPKLPTTEVLRIAASDWGYAGSRAPFFRLVKRLRPDVRPEPMVRFEGLPGEFAQFDFGQANVPFANGERENIHVFVGRLKYSRYLHVIIVPNEQAETLVRSVVECCNVWGGSPMSWVFDNPTTIRISKPGEPIRLHAYLQRLAGEMRVAVELCTPRMANQKGSVERGVGYVKNSFLLVRRFVDRQDLDSQLGQWLASVNHERRCDATREIPAHRLAQERSRLLERPAPWSADEYPLLESLQITPVATIVYRITPYQVDPKAIGTVATTLVHRRTLTVKTVRDTSCTHQRKDGLRVVQRLPGQATETLALLHGERKQNYYKRQCLLEMGPRAAEFLEEVVHRNPNGTWSVMIHRLFLLLETHGQNRLLEALERCMNKNRYDIFAVTAALQEAA